MPPFTPPRSWFSELFWVAVAITYESGVAALILMLASATSASCKPGSHATPVKRTRKLRNASVLLSAFRSVLVTVGSIVEFTDV